MNVTVCTLATSATARLTNTLGDTGQTAHLLSAHEQADPTHAMLSLPPKQTFAASEGVMVIAYHADGNRLLTELARSVAGATVLSDLAGLGIQVVPTQFPGLIPVHVTNTAGQYIQGVTDLFALITDGSKLALKWHDPHATRLTRSGQFVAVVIDGVKFAGDFAPIPIGGITLILKMIKDGIQYVEERDQSS